MRIAIVIVIALVLSIVSVSIALTSNMHRNMQSDKELVTRIVDEQSNVLLNEMLSNPRVQKLLDQLGVKPANSSLVVENVRNVSNDTYIATVEVKITPTFLVEARALVDVMRADARLAGEPMVAANITYMNYVFAIADEELSKIENWLAQNSTILAKVLHSDKLLQVFARNGISVEEVQEEAKRLAKSHSLLTGFAIDPVTSKIKHYYVTMTLVKLGNNRGWVLLNSTNIDKLANLPKICRKVINIELIFKPTQKGFSYLGYTYRTSPCIYFEPITYR